MKPLVANVFFVSSTADEPVRAKYLVPATGITDACSPSAGGMTDVFAAAETGDE